MDQFGPQKIRFEWNDRGTLMPLNDHAAHWANLLGEIVTEFPMYFCSWLNILEEWKAGVLGKIGAEHWVANPDDGTYDVEVVVARIDGGGDDEPGDDEDASEEEEDEDS
ncbi:hypothetical protein Tco_1008544 [Tanacetum coccineum]